MRRSCSACIRARATIALGSDADIAIWDPAKRVTITHSLLQDANDHTPYEGFEVTGWPETTLVRGVPVVQDGRVVAEPGMAASCRVAPTT